MLPCNGCGYRRSIPGNCHIRCVFADWTDLTIMPMYRAVPVRAQQWFRFPFNYDPVWGPDECPNRAETADPAKIAKPDPLADLLSLLL